MFVLDHQEGIISADLISKGKTMGHLFEAAHHALIPEVVRKGLCPFCEQLHDFRCYFPYSFLLSKARQFSTESSTVCYKIVAIGYNY